MTKPHVVLLYHYFHPDDVISARLFSDLACDLGQAGFDVTAMPANRSCHDAEKAYAMSETWLSTRIRRVWRPAWKQSSNLGRVGNACFMLMGWTIAALVMRRRPQETMIVGTDPILAVLLAIPWRILRPRCRIIHWCHDLYPQVAIADGVIPQNSWIVRALNFVVRIAYRRCDVIADLGPCMRQLLLDAHSPAPVKSEDQLRLTRPGTTFTTITPWALVEPTNEPVLEPAVRAQLFGQAKLGLLYSGNLGRAHSFEAFIELARRLREESISLCMSGRGPRIDEVKSALGDTDSNISLAGFASESELEQRLAAADIHLVSLNPQWTGCVIPSKFFGSLSVGRPVLFCGDDGSGIAQWIRQYEVGWVLSDQNLEQVAQALIRYAAEPDWQAKMKHRCRDVYQQQFSRARQVSGFVELCAR